ncbi:MAG: dihydroorotase family protein [Methanomassiliicoccales archaeon]|nr:dihydroorotase family protein [Methanomassiliicoccales archaeon]
MLFDIEITGGTLVTPDGMFQGTIGVKDGRIASLTARPSGSARESYDARNLLVLPGMIDEHVHFMEPPGNDREDFITGSSAAANAGITTVIEHTHTAPVRTVEELDRKKDHLRSRSIIDYGLAAHVWPDHTDELAGMWKRGISFFKAFSCETHGVPGLSNQQMLRAFTKIAKFDGTVMVHCEDESITESAEEELKAKHLSDASVMQDWRSKTAERVAVSNVTFLSQMTRVRTTIAHASHPAVVEIAQKARTEGARISIETCPQYIFLNSRKIKKLGNFGKFTPPSRSSHESAAMALLLDSGVIDTIASDHAPSTRKQKTSGDIWDIHFGVPGIDTTLPLMLTLVNRGSLNIRRLVSAYSEKPAKKFGLFPAKGSIRIGSDADIILVDMNRKWKIGEGNIHSKAKWSPYSAISLSGKAVKTFSRGVLVAEDGKVLTRPGHGRFVSHR